VEILRNLRKSSEGLVQSCVTIHCHALCVYRAEGVEWCNPETRQSSQKLTDSFRLCIGFGMSPEERKLLEELAAYEERTPSDRLRRLIHRVAAELERLLGDHG